MATDGPTYVMATSAFIMPTMWIFFAATVQKCTDNCNNKVMMNLMNAYSTIKFQLLKYENK